MRHARIRRIALRFESALLGLQLALADQASRLLVARMRQLALTRELLPTQAQSAD